MEVTTLDVALRTERGSAQVARLREQGRVPAVLYGGGRDNLSVSVEERSLNRQLRLHHKVFTLSMEGKEQAIFLQDVQMDVLSDRPLHVDFRRIDLSKPLEVEVELAYIGHPKGASAGGALVRDCVKINLSCLPAAIPDSIEVRVNDLDLSDKLFASELQLPPGVTLVVPEDTIVCHMTGELALEQPIEEEAAEAAEAAEGGEAPAEGDKPSEGGGEG